MAAGQADIRPNSLRRLGYVAHATTAAKYATWLHKVYEEPEHLLLQLYLHMRQHLPDEGTVLNVLLEQFNETDSLDKLAYSVTAGNQMMVVIGDRRYVAWPDLKECWSDTWQAEYVEQKTVMGTLSITTAIHLSTLMNRPLSKLE